MKLIWTEAELEQGSDAWIEFRNSNNSLGGSEVAALMGVDFKGKSPQMLYKEKKGMTPPKDWNEAMKRGNRLEPMARAAYQEKYGMVQQICAVHPDYRWMRTSLDSISDNGSVIQEFKCPKNLKNHVKFTKDGKLPDFRYPQVQHQIAVMDAVNKASGYRPVERVDYVSFWVEEDEELNVISTDMKIIPVYPDWTYISELMRREEIFVGYLEREEMPPSNLFLPENAEDIVIVCKG